MKTSEIGNSTWFTRNNSMPYVVYINNLEGVKETLECTDFNVIHLNTNNTSDLINTISNSARAKQHVYVVATDLLENGNAPTVELELFKQQLEGFFKANDVRFYTHKMLKDAAKEHEFIEYCKKHYKKAG